jgi:D-alanine-D-alanine ligase
MWSKRVMLVAIVHNEVKKEDRADEKDVLVQATAVSEALTALGHETVSLACNIDLLSIRTRLEHLGPDMVFNLVESLEGNGRLIYFFPALLDVMGLPYTGSCSEALFLTSHKILAKERMSLAGLPTPQWMGPFPMGVPSLHHLPVVVKEDLWIIKSVWEHGSLGLDDNELISAMNEDELEEIILRRALALGGTCFGELFIQGREFNVSILGTPGVPRVLPPAEIVFENFKEGKTPIVGYRAKWDTASYEYHHTPRRFDFSPDDRPILSMVQSLALRCWEIFGLEGYARVDFRVDNKGQPWILEVNSNPCLSPDAGFMAASIKAGLTFKDTIKGIIMEGYPFHRR